MMALDFGSLRIARTMRRASAAAGVSSGRNVIMLLLLLGGYLARGAGYSGENAWKAPQPSKRSSSRGRCRLPAYPFDLGFFVWDTTRYRVEDQSSGLTVITPC